MALNFEYVVYESCQLADLTIKKCKPNFFIKNFQSKCRVCNNRYYSRLTYRQSMTNETALSWQAQAAWAVARIVHLAYL